LDTASTVQDALGRMTWLRQLVDDDILGLVTEAHYRLVSWNDIAYRLGRSKQSVHQRYYRRVYAAATHARLAADLREAVEYARQRHERGAA
jgi:hypothetical protein